MKPIHTKLGNPASSTPQRAPREIGGLHFQVYERCDDAWIFMGPAEPGSGQQLRTAVVDPRGHAVAVELYFVQPLRP